MGEMDEKVDESQGQASERSPLREIPEEELQRILEAHRKWVESEGKEGERADLSGANLSGAYLFRANLQGADLHGANLQWAPLREANLQGAELWGANLQEANLVTANLQGADLSGADLQGAFLRRANLQEASLVEARGLTESQVKAALNWELAFYSDEFLKKLGLPPDHNERVIKKLAELEKE